MSYEIIEYQWARPDGAVLLRHLVSSHTGLMLGYDTVAELSRMPKVLVSARYQGHAWASLGELEYGKPWNLLGDFLPLPPMTEGQEAPGQDLG
jgi:hypothetical protein